MRKVQRPWRDIVADLNVALRECALSLRELAAMSGCDYHAVRRYKKHGAQNRNAAALTLCTFYKIPIHSSEKLQTESIDVIIGAVQEVWDGSDAHAELMTRLIRSTREFTVSHSQHKN